MPVLVLVAVCVVAQDGEVTEPRQVCYHTPSQHPPGTPAETAVFVVRDWEKLQGYI